MHYITPVLAVIAHKERMNTVQTLCGQFVNVLGYSEQYTINAKEFINHEHRCPDCAAHEDMPMLVLGDI